MSMNQSVVSEKKTQELYTRIYNKTKKSSTKQLSQPTETEGDASGTKTYAGLTKDVNDRVADLEKGIKAERDKLDEHEKNIESSVKAKILDYYGLKRRRQSHSSYLAWKAKNRKLSVRLEIKRMMTFVNAIETLPSLDPASLNLNKYGISTQRLILIVLLLERRASKRNADELKRLAAGSGCQINGSCECPQC